MVVSWRYANLSDGAVEKILCSDRVGHVHYVAIDDLVITTPLKKTIYPPSGHTLVKPVHLC